MVRAQGPDLAGQSVPLTPSGPAARLVAAPDPIPGPVPVQASESLPARATQPGVAGPSRPAGPEPARTLEVSRDTARAAVADPAQQRQSDVAPGPSHPTCTQAQLRRFIKSRPWVPMHELRRRFGIYGADDDVSPIRVGDRTLFIGLPPAEGQMMGELLGTGDVGCELSLDPVAPVVIGVYPMRPVPRS